eukprot:gene12297-14342_t
MNDAVITGMGLAAVAVTFCAMHGSHREAVQRDICACLYFILTILYICTLAYVCFYVVPADEDEMFRGARAVMVGVYGMVILCCGHCIYIMTNGQYRHENGLMWTTQEEKMERMAQLRDQAYEKVQLSYMF